jgi:DNA-binding SARP family transcriptional activator
MPPTLPPSRRAHRSVSGWRAGSGWKGGTASPWTSAGSRAGRGGWHSPTWSWSVTNPPPRQELAKLLWPDSLPPSWDGALSAIISKLRSILGTVGLDGTATLAGAFGCYQLRLPPETWVDVEAAVEALHSAETSIRNGRPEEAWGQDDIARYIARRPFLPGEEGVWVDRIRARLRDVLVRSLDCASVSRLVSHDPDLALKAAEESVHLEPFREVGWQHLMRAQFATGNRAEALRVYERCRKTLAEELGISPSPQTEAVYLEVLRA